MKFQPVKLAGYSNAGEWAVMDSNTPACGLIIGMPVMFASMTKAQEHADMLNKMHGRKE